MTRTATRVRALAIAVLCILPAVGRAQNCSVTSTGRRPLTDLGTDLYLGRFQGGLYPDGLNVDSAAHVAAGLAAGARIVPRDTSGTPDAQNGRVVFMSLGMSNTTGEFCHQGSGTTDCWPESFMGQAAVEPAVNHTTLAIVNGARSGQEARLWLDPAGVNYDAVAELLASQGLSEAQVQAMWVKEADTAPPVTLPSGIGDAYILEGRLGTIARTLKVRYPNIRQVFFSSRIYAGYAVTVSSTEPSAYEGGFAVKWLIEAQIRQMATPLNPPDPGAGDLNDTTVAPWIGWGPYMWADGTTPRSDGLTWTCSEFQRLDGAHLNTFAVRKVGRMLLDFLLVSPVTQTWFPSVPANLPDAPTVSIAAPADGTILQPGQVVTFSGTASDPSDGDLTANLRWTSSIDGPLGSGGDVTTSVLSLGTHWITAEVQDGGGLAGSRTVHVTVQPTAVAFRSIGVEDGYVVDSSLAPGTGRTPYAAYPVTHAGDQNSNTQTRPILSFDTSSIPDDATVVDATLRLKRTAGGLNVFEPLGRLLVDVQTGTFGTAALEAGDFQAVATVPAAASMSNPTVNGDAWSIGRLDVPGLAAINKTGRTQLRLTFEVHDNANGAADQISFASGDNFDVRLWPALDVAYVVPPSGSTTSTTSQATTSTSTSSTSTSTTSTSLATTTSSSMTSSTSSSATTTSATSSTTTTLAGTPETIAFRSIGVEDGGLGESSPGSGVGGNLNSTNGNMQVGDQATNAQSRVIASFDTSTIPATATIVSATLRLNRVGLSGANPFSTLGRLLVDVQAGPFGGNAALQTSDFQAAATAPGRASLSNPATNGAWSSGTFDAAGLAAINRSGGRTQVRLAFEVHDNANAVADRVLFASGDNADPTLWPELDVTYLR